MRDSCVRKVHDYWHAIRPDGGLPRRSDFSPAAITECLPHIFLFQRRPGPDGGPPDYLVRLSGTRLVEFFGKDATGDSVFRYMPEEGQVFFRAMYEGVLNHPAGLLLYFLQASGTRRESELEVLYLPLVLDNEGDKAGLILGIAAKLGEQVWLADMGGRWDTPRLKGGGWMDLGFGKPDDALLRDACAAAGVEYLDL
jgi:hypothetical protein